MRETKHRAKLLRYNPIKKEFTHIASCYAYAFADECEDANTLYNAAHQFSNIIQIGDIIETDFEAARVEKNGYTILGY